MIEQDFFLVFLMPWVTALCSSFELDAIKFLLGVDSKAQIVPSVAEMVSLSKSFTLEMA